MNEAYTLLSIDDISYTADGKKTVALENGKMSTISIKLSLTDAIMNWSTMKPTGNNNYNR